MGPNKLCGCLTILVTKAFDVPLKVEEAATFVKVAFAKQEFFTSVVTDYPGLDALNPDYDASFMVPLTTAMVESSANIAGDIDFYLMNGVDTVLGITTINLSDLALLPGNKLQQKRKIGQGGASIEVQIILYGIDMSQASPPMTDADVTSAAMAEREATRTPMRISLPPVSSVDAPATPRPGEMGKVRITAVRGRGFKAQKKAFQKDNAPDVYLKMKFGSGWKQQNWQTSIIKNSTKPEWNETKNFALDDQEEVLCIDAFNGDKFLGTAQITVSELLLQAMEVELPLTVTKFGNLQSTGAYITVDCDMVTAENIGGNWTPAASSLGMSSKRSSFGSIESQGSAGSLSFGTRDWKEKTRTQVKLEFERMKN